MPHLSFNGIYKLEFISSIRYGVLSFYSFFNLSNFDFE